VGIARSDFQAASQASSGGQFCGSNISQDRRLVNLSRNEYGPCHTGQLVGQRNESNVVMFMQREFFEPLAWNLSHGCGTGGQAALQHAIC
jgi:hypothetical protein